MNRMQGTNRRRLKSLVNVRLSERLADAVRRHAKSMDLTDAAFVRALIVAHIPDADPADAAPVRRSLHAPFLPPPSVVHDLDHAREVAAEATGMLKLAAQRYRETGMSEQHADAEVLLLTMREAATSLLHLHADITARWRAYYTDLAL